MSKLIQRSYMTTAAIVVVPLAVCALVPWIAGADGASTSAVRVVDAFLNARAARDVSAVAALLDENAQIVDSSRDRTTETRTGDLYQLLPLAETVDFGARTQTDGGEVTWIETVEQSGRPPSWENNLSWWVDGNDALQVELTTPDIGKARLSSAAQASADGLAPARDTRAMQASVTRGKITRLTMTPVASLETSMPTTNTAAPRSGGTQITRLLALVSPLALLACVLVGIVCLEPTARPASDRGSLLHGLTGWVAVRQDQRRR